MPDYAALERRFHQILKLKQQTINRHQTGIFAGLTESQLSADLADQFGELPPIFLFRV